MPGVALKKQRDASEKPAGGINSVVKMAGESFCVSKLREIKMGPGGGGGGGGVNETQRKREGD